ncbi:MAG: SagB/ThcOx family dehydrogenase [Promethearchaeota archaeon]
MDIKLIKPKHVGTISIEQCIYMRKSVRAFTDNRIEIEKISQILWAAQGKSKHRRTVPSAGGTYPLEIFIILKNQGLYHYNFLKNLLILKIQGDLNEKLAQASLNQMFIRDAPLNLIICVDYSRTTNRYGKRGKRYVLIEVGHCAQNIHLQCIAMGLESVPIGAFKDEQVKLLLNLPHNLDPIYIIPIGYKK